MLPQDDDDDGDTNALPAPGPRRSSKLAMGVPAVRYDEVAKIAADFMNLATVTVVLEGEKESEWEDVHGG